MCPMVLQCADSQLSLKELYGNVVVMSFDAALFDHIENSPNRTVSAAQAALHLGNQPVPQVRRKLIQIAEASGGVIQVRYPRPTAY